MSMPVGEKHWRSKLTDEQVRVMRALRKQGVSLRRLAKQFGVSHVQVFHICNRVFWKHLKEE